MFLLGFTLTECLALALVFLVAYSYLSRFPWKRLPPGPLNYPVVGSLPRLNGDLRIIFAEMSAKFGDVFMLYFGPSRVVILNGFDTIKEALLENAGQFDERSHMFDDFTEHLGPNDSSGDHAKEHRRLLLRAMKDFGFSGRRMENMINEESQQLIHALEEECGKPFNPELTLKKAVSNIISRLFGRHYEYDDAQFLEHIRVSDDIMNAVGADNPVWTFPFLKYLPGDIFCVKKVVKDWFSLLDTYGAWISEHKRHQADGEEPSDIMGLYLKELEKQPPGGQLSIRALQHTMSQVYNAGTDSTAVTLLWALQQLLINPHIYQQVQTEVDTAVGQGRQPTMQDRYSMPYTEAFITEVQRWADLIPFSVPHYTSKERQFRGYTIPAHTIIFPNLNSVHHDPKLWTDPGTFNPERFLEDGKFKASEAVIPFSIGKRSCVGEGLARMEIFLFLVNLLQTYKFSVPVGRPAPTGEGILTILNKPVPYEMVMERRD